MTFQQISSEAPYRLPVKDVRQPGCCEIAHWGARATGLNVSVRVDLRITPWVEAVPRHSFRKRSASGRDNLRHRIETSAKQVNEIAVDGYPHLVCAE